MPTESGRLPRHRVHRSAQPLLQHDGQGYLLSFSVPGR